jgi:hypothetical protein
MSRPREIPAPAPVETDTVAQASRYRRLLRWIMLTPGPDAELPHHGSLDQRLAALELHIDQHGRRAAAEAFLASLEAGAERTRRHIETLKQQGYGPA